MSATATAIATEEIRQPEAARPHVSYTEYLALAGEGQTLESEEAVIVSKLSPTGKLVIITVYRS
ncbi:MAG: hypothetical protein HY784_06255 [Chloroflexi bacterium]|nr:hypothetical protein [Chloroflexota bacterium]